MKSKCTLIILLGCLVFGLCILTQKQINTSSFERRHLTTTQDLNEKSMLNESFQDTFEEVLKDQFILRNALIKGYYQVKQILYSGFSGNVRIADDVVKVDDTGFYVKKLLEFDQESYNTAENRGYNISEYAKKYPNQKVYVYKPTRLEETSLLNSNHYYSYGSEYNQAFRNQLIGEVTYCEQNVYTFEDYFNSYYKTDIHWNIHGAYQGYQQIINMFQKDFEIDDPREIVETISAEYDFYGAISNNIARTTDADCIEDYVLKGIPEYDYYVNHVLSDDTASKMSYLENSNESIYSDYDQYFGNNDYLRVYDFHQEDKPNLLIFSDSFINPIKTWLASHFNQTIIVDLRGKPAGEELNLDELIQKYSVDATLVLQYYDNLYFNGYNFLPIY